MKAIRVSRCALALLFSLALLGCGGSAIAPRSGNDEASPNAGSAQQSVPLPDMAALDWSLKPSQPAPDALLETSALSGLSSDPLHAPAARPMPSRSASSSHEEFRGLPRLPQDAGRKQTSVAYTATADPATPVERSANVTTGGASATLGSTTGQPAWAYYGLPTWATRTSQTAKITGSLPVKVNGFKSGIYIALANYTTGRWQFFPSVYNLTAPATVNFRAGDDYISPGGNVYILLASWNGDVAQITGIETAGNDSNVAPSAALSVSVDLGYDGFATVLDAGASADSDLSIVKYEFDLGDGAGFIDNGASPVLNANINGAGGRFVTVRVTDEGGLADEAQAIVYAIDPATYLPFAWYRARMNGGLGLATMGFADIFQSPTPRVFPNFFFEGASSHTGYIDLRSKLPIWFDGWLNNAEELPASVDAMQNRVENAGGIQALLLEANAQYWAQHRITEQTFDPTLDAAQPLAAALATFVSGAGGTPDQPTYNAAVSGFPLPQQEALARVVLAAHSARARREAAFAAMGLPAEAVEALYTAAHGDRIENGLVALNTGQYIGALYDVTGGNFLLSSFPYADAFFTGAAEIADALDQLRAFDEGTSPNWGNVNLMINTPAGRIQFAGTSDNTHSPVSNGHALLIDLGGEDTYDCPAGANAGPLNPVSLCIDLGGDDDTYIAMDDPLDIDRTSSPSDDNTSQQGAGRMGIGILYESGGNDEYTSVRLSQGSAVAGVGILADLGGNDKYEFEALGQGGAFAGIGILLDEGGNDTYESWQKAQGWGGIMGVGLLADRGSGTDTYLANPGFDPARPEYGAFFGLAALGANLSLAQGAGNGLPPGLISVNGTPIAGGGGLGVLFDGGGSDTLAAGAFAQGAAHYQSTGLCLETGGGDTYQAFALAQGAAANTGLACLFDAAGGDSYTSSLGPAQGAGDGLALGWLVDRAGADTYNAPAISLGTGRANGFGYFVEFLGADQYAPTASGFENTTLGLGTLGTGSADLPAYGIFVDDAGMDTYALDYSNMANVGFGAPPVNGGFWVRAVEGPYLRGRGSGIDTP